MPEEHICFGAGSTQLLTAIAEISVGPGEKILSPEIVWRRFQGVYRAVAADVTFVPNNGDGSIDVPWLQPSTGASPTQLAKGARAEDANNCHRHREHPDDPRSGRLHRQSLSGVSNLVSERDLVANTRSRSD